MIEYKDLVHKKILEYRALERYIESPEWGRVWEQLDVATRKMLVESAAGGQTSVQTLELLAAKYKQSDLWQMSCRELRALAQSHQVRYYGRLSKHALISEIMESRRERTRNSNGEPKADLRGSGTGDNDKKS